MKLPLAMLRRISREIELGNAVWALRVLNEYTATPEPLRAALYMKAGRVMSKDVLQQLKAGSYESLPHTTRRASLPQKPLTAHPVAALVLRNQERRELRRGAMGTDRRAIVGRTYPATHVAQSH